MLEEVAVALESFQTLRLTLIFSRVKRSRALSSAASHRQSSHKQEWSQAIVILHVCRVREFDAEDRRVVVLK